MANAKRDDNYIPTLLAVSNADGSTPVALYADPTTHRLLVSIALTIEAPTGNVDDNNTAFTFTAKPTLVIVNGAIYRENKGWTWSSPIATISAPVGTGGDIYGIL